VIPIGSTCVKKELLANLKVRWRWNHVSFENHGIPIVAIITDRLICRTSAKRKAQMRNKGFNVFIVFFTCLVVAENQLGNNMLVFGSRDNGLWERSEEDVTWNRLDPTETVRRTRTNTVSDMTMSSMSKHRSMRNPFLKYLLIGGAIGGIVPQRTILIINDTPVIVGSFVPGAAKERQEVVHILHLLGSVERCANRFFCSPTIDVVDPHLFPSRGFVSNKVTTIDELIRIILELNRSGVNESMLWRSQIASMRCCFLTDSRSNGSKEEGCENSLHSLEIVLFVGFVSDYCWILLVDVFEKDSNAKYRVTEDVCQEVICKSQFWFLVMIFAITDVPLDGLFMSF
jgi:hypothetical protein